MIITMKDYKEIRQRFQAGESQRSIARALNISRNTVAKYCSGDSVPWQRKPYKRNSPVLTDEMVSFIRFCLEQDEQEGLKKQKHTARRIYDRLVDEKGFTGGESTVRRKVRELKAVIPDVFIPLEFDPGEALQIDWGEAFAYIRGFRESINLFCARLCYSCRPVVLAYHRQNEESFLDAFVRTFEILGGTPEKVIFDNARVAVKDGFGSHAKKQAGYTALTAHYGFDALFCNPAEGHEKGLVEGLVGWARRNIMVPVPHVDSMEELNTLLLERCTQYGSHTIRGRHGTVADLFLEEAPKLHPLPGYRFETAKSINTRVDSFSTVRFRTNRYSVPVRYAGKQVGIKGYPESIQIFFNGDLIASHERIFAKNKASYQLEHYLPLLEQRRRAILNAAPVRQNVPPEIFAQLQKMDHPDAIKLLREQVAVRENSVDREIMISDPVHIRDVDLHQYDLLSTYGGTC